MSGCGSGARRIALRAFKPGAPGMGTVLGELETTVMELLWTEPGQTVTDVERRLLLARAIAHTTVLTTLDRLHRKGYLTRKKQGKAFFYTPRFSRDEFERGMAEEVLGALRFKTPITFYQAQSGGGLNAALAFLPSEAHVILVGPILNTLSAAELKAISKGRNANWRKVRRIISEARITGSARRMRHRKSCRFSSGVGALNDVMRTPCGSTTPRTCRTVFSGRPALL